MKLIFMATLVLVASGGWANAESATRPWGPSESGWATIDGKALPDTDFRRSAGPFCAELWLVSDPEFFEKWDRPSHVFEYRSVDRIERGEWLVAIVAFSNATLDPERNPDLVLDIRIVEPDGRVKGGIQGERAWKGPPMPEDSRNKLELTTKYLLYRVEDEDPLGTHRVEATLTDALSKKSLTMTRTVTIAPRSGRSEAPARTERR